MAISKVYKIIFALTLLTVFGYAVLVVGVPYIKENVRDDEAGALSAVRALRTIQANYWDEHHTFAGSFEELGVPLGARLVDGELIWGGGYRFQLIVPSRKEHGILKSYEIVGRPISYGWFTRRAFWVDETGKIRSTTENRVPTNRDPILQ